MELLKEGYWYSDSYGKACLVVDLDIKNNIATLQPAPKLKVFGQSRTMIYPSSFTASIYDDGWFLLGKDFLSE